MKRMVKLLGENWIEYASYYQDDKLIETFDYKRLTMPQDEPVVNLKVFKELREFLLGGEPPRERLTVIPPKGRYLIAEFYSDENKNISFISGESGWCPPSVDYNRRDAFFKFIVVNRHELRAFQQLLADSLLDFVAMELEEYKAHLDIVEHSDDERKTWVKNFCETLSLYFDGV